MRTTYRGINRAKELKQYREMLEYQKLKAEGKAQSLKEKYFGQPTRLERLWSSIKAIF